MNYPPDFVAWINDHYPQFSGLLSSPPVSESIPDLIRRVGHKEAFGEVEMHFVGILANAVQEELCRYASSAS